MIPIFSAISGQPSSLVTVFYFAEKALQSAAKEAGLLTSGQKITVNNWNYTLVRAGGVCMVQSYTPSPSELARAARFRETHAAVKSLPELPTVGTWRRRARHLRGSEGKWDICPVGKLI
jgi:hypothetical protein